MTVLKITIICLAFFATSTAVGQTPSNSASPQNCNLTTAQSPEIRGFRLGMSIEQLMNLFPEETNRASIQRAIERSRLADSFGVGSFNAQPENRTVNARFTGVHRFFVTLLDERVAAFAISYVGPQWDDVDQFINRLAGLSNLPRAETWSVGTHSDTKVLRCNGFEMNARIFTADGESNSVASNGSCSISVSDLSFNRTVETRRRQAREEAQRAFRP